MDGLEIELTRAPGHVEGHVLLPEGHEPAEIWLSLSGWGRYMSLRPDASYRLANLRPGRRQIHVVGAFGSGDWSPVSTSISRDDEDRYFTMSHGPSRAPDWLTSEPSFFVEVVPGETTKLDLDLASEMPVRLKGRIRIDGKAPDFIAPTGSMYSQPRPQIILDHGDRFDTSARADLREDGTFELGVQNPGPYRLEIGLNLKGGAHWAILDRVELVAGDNPWTLQSATGSVRVKPKLEDGKLSPFSGMLRWQGPEDLRIFARYGVTNEKTRVSLFPKVPDGSVQLVLDRDGQREIQARLVVEAGVVSTTENAGSEED